MDIHQLKNLPGRNSRIFQAFKFLLILASIFIFSTYFYITSAKTYGVKGINTTVISGMERRLPTVIIIGGMKCGTGALRKFLSLHPDTVTSYEEETMFFGKSYTKGVDWYRAQMHPSRSNQLTFEKSIYFPNPFNAPRNIYETNKNMKLILMLRNPVQRTISHFARAKAFFAPYVRDCPMLWKCVINNRTGEVIDDNGFIDYSLYYKHLSEWLVYFPLKQFLFLDGDLFVENPLPAMKRVEQFLGLRDYFNDSVLYYDRTKGFYCYRTAQNKTDCLPKWKGRKHPFVSRGLMKRLYKFFKPHNEMLFALIKKRMDWS